ncbi:hypothetical protein SAY87_005809 [Trapa incisa]|uniref:Uncharacterized protein n=1 Tax=Trapa incisa TaxID=236973 RepID=A0AAN7K6H7_9MYRT|nr:hypothetical protein SAY87_005809 [Trapa incisa]
MSVHLGKLVRRAYSDLSDAKEGEASYTSRSFNRKLGLWIPVLASEPRSPQLFPNSHSEARGKFNHLRATERREEMTETEGSEED